MSGLLLAWRADSQDTANPMTSEQTDLFAGSPSQAAPVGPAPVGPEFAEVASRLPEGVRLGTSSWTFPGWAGIVYDRTVTQATLSEHGLAAYARHPLLTTVGVDRSYYRPIPAGTLRRYAEAVPPLFRFLLKGPRDVLFPSLGSAAGSTSANPSFLDADLAARSFVEPVVESLGGLVGPLVFQFPPLELRRLGGARAFLERLAGFLSGLPPGPLYAVELRNRELLGPEYRGGLGAAGATHCFNVHPSMPSLAEQRAAVGPVGARPLVVRWMLGHGLRYEAARDRYRPFNALVDPDPASREAIAELCREVVTRGSEAYVIVNNKAEGSSPLSVIRLAEELAG
jgi:uncharacterized protein YecE (DUF72 family)